MIKYLIVLLDNASVPFCHYEVDSDRPRILMPLELLGRVVDHAIRNGLHINFVYGDRDLPEAYERIIGSVGHIKIMPLANRVPGEGVVPVLDDSRPEDAAALEDSPFANIILRVGTDRLADLVGMVRQLLGKFGRLNIILKDIPGFGDEILRIYRGQLEKIGELVAGEYRKGNFIEINTVTDRIFLNNMNNCGAGVDHLTVAPDGRYYLCPAFYYGGQDNGLGELGGTVQNENSRLLELDYAPICRNCDAYHCKRCVYLNRELTLELNTPSGQQCRIAHLERNLSRELLAVLRAEFDGSETIAPIPELDYLDPFEMLSSREIDGDAKDKHFASLLSGALEEIPVTRLLQQIYRLDPSLLAKLKHMNHVPVDLQPRE